jgi:Ca-activated chloride channel family protein
MDRFGLFTITETTRTKLPLKGVECDFSVLSGVAEVAMTQIFRQENPAPVNCEFLFPLPADASVYFCEADINGRRIRAQVREREEARQLVAEKKAAGFRTAMVESERDNLFTLSLGNVQPDDLVIVELKYFQTLRSLAGMPSIEIPFCPGERYIPGNPIIHSNRGKGVVDDTDAVPDASRIRPVRIDFTHPDAAYVDIRGRLDAKFVCERDLGSPSHPITVHRAGDEIRVTLSDKGDVPDRDFVLRWRETNVESVVSRAWCRAKDQEVYALLEIRAPQNSAPERAPVDFYFLVDRSGSMANEKWFKAVEALQSCLKVLTPSDRAMVTFFESAWQDFAERPLNPKQLLEDEKFQNVAKLGARGGTELARALQHVLEMVQRHSSYRPKNLILITDAQIGNEPAILELTRTAPDLPVHCFGMDFALNDALLLALCRQQGGTFHSMNPNDDVQTAVSSLGRTLGQPVLLDLRLSDGWEAANACIPNLYAGQVHYLSARSRYEKPLELCARTDRAEPLKLSFSNQSANFDSPYLHWCKSRIERLVAEGKDREAVQLSIKSNQVCTLTAFVAWDESEKVPIARHELVQPSLQDRLLGLEGACTFVSDVRLLRHAATDRQTLLSKMRSAEIPSTKEKVLALLEKTSNEKLDDICRRLGVTSWKALLKAIWKWLNDAPERERFPRNRQVLDLIEQIEQIATPLLSSTSAPDESKLGEAAKQVHQILSAFVEKLPPRKRFSWLGKPRPSGHLTNPQPESEHQQT